MKIIVSRVAGAFGAIALVGTSAMADKVSPKPAGSTVHFTVTGTFADGRSFDVVADVDGDGDGALDQYVLTVTCTKGALTSAILSPRDSSSGMATGKRQYKPLLIRKEAADDWMAGKIAGSTGYDLKNMTKARTTGGTSITLDNANPALCR